MVSCFCFVMFVVDEIVISIFIKLFFLFSNWVIFFGSGIVLMWRLYNLFVVLILMRFFFLLMMFLILLVFFLVLFCFGCVVFVLLIIVLLILFIVGGIMMVFLNGIIGVDILSLMYVKCCFRLLMYCCRWILFVFMIMCLFEVIWLKLVWYIRKNIGKIF